MGDNNRAMKFIAHCIEFQTDNPSELLKSVIVLTLTAPYRLVTEISSKIIFLGKMVLRELVRNMLADKLKMVFAIKI